MRPTSATRPKPRHRGRIDMGPHSIGVSKTPAFLTQTSGDAQESKASTARPMPMYGRIEVCSARRRLWWRPSWLLPWRYYRWCSTNVMDRAKRIAIPSRALRPVITRPRPDLTLRTCRRRVPMITMAPSSRRRTTRRRQERRFIPSWRWRAGPGWNPPLRRASASGRTPRQVPPLRLTVALFPSACRHHAD